MKKGEEEVDKFMRWLNSPPTTASGRRAARSNEDDDEMALFMQATRVLK